ncbi:uncharacterized protein LOC143073343 [Mytilus galloprovincialis]|uniref:uncharacterized protein LOC143073343 n=1 Tax=Mytilus galloprovincialis TaxID=29158 RepID=UPI003F7BAFF1
MAFSQSIRKGQIPVNCGLCETGRPIKWKCLDCDLLLCNHCKEKVHLRVKTAKDHRIIDLKDIGLHKEELDFANIPCQDHAGQNNCLYCKTCDSLICPTCVAKVHKKHDLTEIQEGYNIKIDKLKNGQRKIQSKRKEIVSYKKQLNQLLSSENYKYNQVNQAIQKHEQSVKVAVERYFKKLRVELDQNLETVSNTIKSDLNAISDLLNQAEEKDNEVQELIHITYASKFFSDANKARQKTNDIDMPNTRSSYETIPNFVPGEITQSNIGVLEYDENLSNEPHINLAINKQYQTELEVVDFVCSSIDQSFWISSGPLGLVQKVKSDGTNLKVLSSYNIQVYGMAVTQSNNLLLCTEGSRLQEISCNTGRLTDSVYDVSPFLPTAVHVTSDNKVLVAGVNSDYPEQGRRVVILMDQNGDHDRVFEHDQYKQPIFTYPCRLTCTNRNIHVVDRESDDRYRVVVLGQGGDIINIYTGDTEINKDEPFRPEGIMTTPRDNVIVSDPGTNTLHILNNDGFLMTYYKTSDINIMLPMSLVFTQTGKLYIGCSTPGDSTEDAKIYEVTISGC